MDTKKKALAEHLNANEDGLIYEEIDSTINGAVLYQVEDDGGEVRWVIEGETGDLVGNYQTIEEAMEEWNL